MVTKKSSKLKIIFFTTSLFSFFNLFDAKLFALEKGNKFSINGKTHSPNDVPQVSKNAFLSIEQNVYDSEVVWVDETIFELHLEGVMKSKKFTHEQAEKEVLGKAAEPISEKEAKDWFDAHPERTRGQDFNNLKNMIMGGLLKKKIEDEKIKIVEELKKAGKFVSFLKPPLYKINTQGFMHKGKPGAKYKLIEFADALCPHCRIVYKEIEKFLEANKTKDIEFVFIDFPLDEKPDSANSQLAMGAHCASKQDKYWEYHHLAFTSNDAFSHTAPSMLAVTLKLDITKFNACMAVPETKEFIKKSRELGAQNGVQGTPTFYLNGKKINFLDENKVDETLQAEIH